MPVQHTKNDINAVLQQYTSDTGVHSAQKVEKDFAHVAQHVPAEDIAVGLSEAFRSEHTPAFSQMVGDSYEQGDDQQRAGMLDQLLDGADALLVKPMPNNRQLQGQFKSDQEQNADVAAAGADQLHPELVQQIADEVDNEDHNLIDKMSSYYAEDPSLAKTLGGPMLSVVLGKIAENK